MAHLGRDRTVAVRDKLEEGLSMRGSRLAPEPSPVTPIGCRIPDRPPCPLIRGSSPVVMIGSVASVLP